MNFLPDLSDKYSDQIQIGRVALKSFGGRHSISGEIYTKQTPHIAYKNIPTRNYIDDITNYMHGKIIA